MYLKRLELAGFKTFADRTELEFHPGVTAIVGPNGSGKSNLCEAIRWVLGEQNAHALRGVRTEDFIFAGSAKRRAHGLAQVSLILDNAEGHLPLEFSEISVMRRATRGGEGEFFLSGLPCRLRDIQMLFLGTGLGGRSYALIGQGEVDAVLNASPQERRLLLEEAAGLARYKRRRHESLRRLEHTAAHLQRVGDLLSELRAQHARLAEQAEAARQHRAHTEEIRTIEMGLIADEARRLRQVQQRCAAQSGSARARVAELEQRAEEARRQALAHQQARDELTRSWETHQRRLLEMVRAQAAAESAVERAESRLAEHRRDEERLRADLARLEAELQESETARAAVAAERERWDQETAAARRELDAHRAALKDGEASARSHQVEITALEARRTDLLAERQRIFGQAAGLEARRQLLQRQQATVVERRQRLGEQLAAAAAEETRLRERVAEAREALEGQRERFQAAVANLRRQEAKREAVIEEVRAADARRHRLESRLQALEEAGVQLLGYEEGARTLMLAKQADPRRFGSIVGALVDHIDVEPRFRVAVEAALGRRLYCLLTTGTDVLREALAYVRADGRGPVSFLPLDRIAARHPNGPLPDVTGVLGSAATFVTARAQARKAVEVLLSDVVVVEDLEVALRLLAAGHRGRAVTLQGELVSPDGVISVRGSRNGEGSPLTRRTDVAEGRRDVQALLTALAALRERQEIAERELAAARTEAAGLEQERTRFDHALAEAEATLGAATRERARIPAEINEVDGEAAALVAALAEVETRSRELAAEAERLEAAVRETDARIADQRRAEESQETAVAAHRRRAEEMRVRLAELEGRRQAVAAREEDFAARRDAIAGRRTPLLAAEAAVSGERSRREHEVTTAGETRARIAREQADMQAQLTALEAERTGREEAAAGAQDLAAGAEEEARAAEAALHRAELRATQAETEWGAMERRLQESGLTGDQAESMQLPLPRDEARGRLEALRGLVAAMGPVNLRAIHEQDELAARIERIARQVADIEAARAVLNELLERLDGILRLRFRETFAAVNEEFGRLFVRLFEGGSAHLELVQETAEPAPDGKPEGKPEADPGLEVVVRLPGKPPRSLAALSGGERVLVALALLFAMLRVHPSPFCVFDEVEAALDDANTRRFTTLLRELAESTQIIIVTHNKGTMEAADILYGVTMQEPGVSSILSVRLGERNGTNPSTRPTEPVESAR